MKHPIPTSYLQNRISVLLVGAGGNGSQMLTGLARLDAALKALDHPGLAVTVCDPDVVTEANVGRQLFSPADVGQYKATLLTWRVNAFYGLDWIAYPVPFAKLTSIHCNIIIGCVDTAAARREIAEKARSLYWLDLGNDQVTGQVILGGHGLPTVLDCYPELRVRKKEDNTPSCSLAGALEKQDLFINQAVTTWGLHLLWTLFRRGGVDHHGYYINLQSGRVAPLPVPDATSNESKARTHNRRSVHRTRPAPERNR